MDNTRLIKTPINVTLSAALSFAKRYSDAFILGGACLTSPSFRFLALFTRNLISFRSLSVNDSAVDVKPNIARFAFVILFLMSSGKIKVTAAAKRILVTFLRTFIGCFTFIAELS